jgi:hypothetical protein
MAVEYKLVAPLLNFFTTTTGTPAIGYYLFSYKASDHVTPKSIAKLAGPAIPGDFYANPIELDASGSVPAPYALYFADDELYYLVLKDPTQTSIIRTWDNFGVQPAPGPTPDEVDYTNYMLNAQYRFWRYQTRSTTDLVANEDVYIADSGWIFNRNNTSSTCTIEFKEFSPGQTDVPHNPIYYLDFNCSSIGSGETEKDALLKIADVRAFAGTTVQIAFYAESVNSSLTELVAKQYFGSGGSTTVTTLNQVQLTNVRTQYIVSVAIGSVAGKTIGDGNALYIGLRAPLNAIGDFQITNWQLNRGDTLLEFNYKTPEIEQGTQRAYQLPYMNDENMYNLLLWAGENYEAQNWTGLIALGLEKSRPGWALCDGSTYKTLDHVSGTNNRITYRRLWDYWEANADEPNGNAFGYGPDGFYPQSKVSNEVTILNTKADTAITAWSDNDTGATFTTLTTGGDKRIISVPPSGTFIALQNNTVDGWPGFNNIILRNKDNGVVSAPTIGTMPPANFAITPLITGSPTEPQEDMFTFTISVGSMPTLAGKYWTWNTTVTGWYIWYRVNGVGTDPAPGGRTGILIEIDTINYAQSEGRLAYQTAVAIPGLQLTKIALPAGSTLSGGEYCNVYNSTEHYVPYFVVDGVGTAPTVIGATAIPVAITSSDTNVEVMEKWQKEIKAIYFNVPDFQSYGVRFTAYNAAYTGGGIRFSRHDGLTGNHAGTYEFDEFRSHNHLLAGGITARMRAEDGSTGANSSPTGRYLGAGALYDGPDLYVTTYDTELNANAITVSSSQTIDYTGFNETRMRNVNLNAFVKL